MEMLNHKPKNQLAYRKKLHVLQVQEKPNNQQLWERIKKRVKENHQERLLKLDVIHI